MNHTNVIYEIVRGVKAKTYLELGIYEGETFLKIFPIVERAVGVDIVDKRKEKLGEFHLKTTNDFFKDFNEDNKFDVIFIDADHSFEQVKLDLICSLDILSIGGIIFIHDTDPAREELIDPGYCGDSYKIIDFLRKTYPKYLDFVTLPICDPGLTIIKNMDGKRIKYLNEMDKL